LIFVDEQEEAVEVLQDVQELYVKDRQDLRQAQELYHRMSSTPSTDGLCYDNRSIR
jgi:hypothetical protein